MKDKIKTGIIIALAILFVITLVASGILYRKFKNEHAEVVMWNDSTHYYQNKLGEEYLAKNTYILEIALLKEYNEELYKECLTLKDNPLVIVKTDVVSRIDTVYTTIDQFENLGDRMNWEWHANDSTWYTINGESGIHDGSPFTKINTLKFDARLTMDVIDDGKQLEIIAKSDNPYVKLGNMNSVVLNPNNSQALLKFNKPKRWGFGPTISAGLYMGYSFVNRSFDAGVGGMIGVSIHYDLIQW